MSTLATAEVLTDRYVDLLREHQPTAMTGLGDHARDHDLPDLAPDALDRWIRDVSVLRDDVEAARSELPRRERTGDVREADGDLEMLALELDGALFHLRTRPALEVDPLGALGTASSSLHELLRRTELDPEAQRTMVVAATARARRLPQFIEQAGELLRATPAPHLEVALQRIQGLIALVRDELPARAERVGADVVAARDAGAVASEALGSYAALITELGRDRTIDWRLGPEDHATALRVSLGTDMAVDEIAGRARVWVAECQDRLATDAEAFLVAAGLDVPAERRDRIRRALDVVGDRTVAPDRLVAQAADAVATARAWAERVDIVDLPPADLLSITEVPAYLQGVAVAFISAPPALETETGCTYYLSPIPESWTAEQARSFLREYNLSGLQNLALHEAVPGHFVQLEHAAQHPRLNRRMLVSSAFVEGWAIHIERVAVRMGYGDDIPDVDAAAYRLNQAKMELRVATNALLDIGLHTGDLDDDAALDLLAGEAFQQRAEASGKLVRGKVTAGQLCSYFVGGEELRDLETSRQQALGAEFDLRRFHQQVLSHGSATTSIVRAALEDPTAQVERRPFARSGRATPAG